MLPMTINCASAPRDSIVVTYHTTGNVEISIDQWPADGDNGVNTSVILGIEGLYELADAVNDAIKLKVSKLLVPQGEK